MRTQFFVGTRLTPELKMQLGAEFAPLICIPYEGKQYLGHYLEAERPTVGDVQNACTHLLSTLQQRCPEHRVDNLPVVVFPQLFVG